jgi:hypothetical protein
MPIGRYNSGLIMAVVPEKPSGVIPTTVRIRPLIRRVFPKRPGSAPDFRQNE